MSDILTHALSGFWQFIGCLVILWMLIEGGLSFLLRLVALFLKHLNVWKHGWPKPDREFKETLNENN